MKDEMGDRMKDLETGFRLFLPRKCYTFIRIDGKAFHSYTKGFDRPFDLGLRRDMQETTKALCEEIQGCKIGYTQSDEISLLLTDFDNEKTGSWFDGNLQKISSVSASVATANFNFLRTNRLLKMGRYDPDNFKLAMFDSRVWVSESPWDAFNVFWWRQKDCTRNAVQMVARTMYSHKQLEGKGFKALKEMIAEKGRSFDEGYPLDCQRGSFVYKNEDGWKIDIEPPNINNDREYFFSKIAVPEGFDYTKIEPKKEDAV